MLRHVHIIAGGKAKSPSLFGQLWTTVPGNWTTNIIAQNEVRTHSCWKEQSSPHSYPFGYRGDTVTIMPYDTLLFMLQVFSIISIVRSIKNSKKHMTISLSFTYYMYIYIIQLLEDYSTLITLFVSLNSVKELLIGPIRCSCCKDRRRSVTTLSISVTRPGGIRCDIPKVWTMLSYYYTFIGLDVAPLQTVVECGFVTFNRVFCLLCQLSENQLPRSAVVLRPDWSWSPRSLWHVIPWVGPPGAIP